MKSSFCVSGTSSYFLDKNSDLDIHASQVWKCGYPLFFSSPAYIEDRDKNKKKGFAKKFLNVKLITQSVIVALWSVPEIPATEHNFVILEYSLLDQK